METRANYIIVGLFTLAVIAGVFGFVYWFHNIGGTGERALYKIEFQEPIGGLRNGATVSFNGIRVGEVIELSLNPNHPTGAVATISVIKNTPVRADTKVGLDYQGMTGIATLALRGGAFDAPPLVAQDGKVPALVAERGASQDLMMAARDAIQRIDNFIADNEESFGNSLRNIESFSAALSRNSDKVDRIMAGLGNLVSDGRRTLGAIERTVKNIDENPRRLIFGSGNSGQSPTAMPGSRTPPAATAAGSRRKQK